MALLLGGLSFIGIAIRVYGLSVRDLWSIIANPVLAMGTMAWFLDPMV